MERLWLDEEACLFPGPRHPGQDHQEKPVRFPKDGLLALSTQDNQLVTEERMFRHQFGLASGEIGERVEYQGGRRWVDPTQKNSLECGQVETDALLDLGEETTHEWNLPFPKKAPDEFP